MPHAKKKIPDGQSLLQAAGLRSTRQRQALAGLLFDGEHKHMTAEEIHAAMRKRRVKVSLATVYNTLHQFTDAGLLHQIGIDSSRIYFDTNVDAHHHFFDEDSGRLIDVAASAVRISQIPKPPAGAKIDRIDVVIRVRS